MTTKRKIRKIECSHCGNNFYAKSTLAKYCRVSCQTQAWRHASRNRQEQLAHEYEAELSEVTHKDAA